MVLRIKIQSNYLHLGGKTHGWKRLLSFTLCVCYADSSHYSHLCRLTYPLLFLLTHLLFIAIFAIFPAFPPKNFPPHHFAFCSFHFTDHSTSSSHSAVSVSHSSFLDDEEFSDFIQGPTESPKVVPQSTSQPFQPFHSATGAGQLLSEKAVVQPLPPAQTPVLSILHGTAGHVPYFPTSASSLNIHKTGNSEVLFYFIFDNITFSRKATESLYLFCWFFSSVWLKDIGNEVEAC